MIKLDDDKKKKLIAYFSALITTELDARRDMHENIQEYWQRHLNKYSCKKDKSFPWVGSADFQSGLIETADTLLEAQFAGALNTLKPVGITAGTSTAAYIAAKKVESFFNNYWVQKSGMKKVLLDAFQYWIVEGQMFLGVIPYTDGMKKKYKRYKSNVKIVDTIKRAYQYISGQDGEYEREEKTSTDYLGAVWQNIPTVKVGWDRNAASVEKCNFFWCEFDLSNSEIRKKIKEQKWIDSDSILPDKDKTNILPDNEKANNTEEEDKNDYQGFSDTKTSKKTFYRIYAYYDFNDDGNDEKIELVLEKDTFRLFYIDYNPFFDGRIPYVSAPFYTIAGRIPGQSNPARLANLSDEFDTLQNQIIDNNTLTNTFCGTALESPGFVVDKIKVKPGLFIPVKSHDALKVWTINNRINDMSYQQQTVLSLFERKSLVNDTMAGRESADSNKQTYRGLVTLLKQNAVSLNRPMQNFQEALVEAVKQTIMCLYEFMPADGIRYAYTKNGEAGDENAGHESDVLKREDLEYMDEFNIGVLNGVVDIMLDAEKQVAMFLLQAFGQDNSGEINTFEIKKNIIETMAPRLAKTIIREPREVQALKMVMAKGQELAAKEQALMGLQEKILGEQQSTQESAFMQELANSGVPEEEWPSMLQKFRSQHGAGGVEGGEQQQSGVEGNKGEIPQ
ncbi:MAG: hypothetical protein A2231_03170 [Candidatus Firestonebacteria bacterium RIFOXYA2_FULL_40_8]|nr:MAG: hypothetical protein A2231_03170 [Candidatus Firestonebacteria bacterium RIFOXYA2_FULL_40_8]